MPLGEGQECVESRVKLSLICLIRLDEKTQLSCWKYPHMNTDCHLLIWWMADSRGGHHVALQFDFMGVRLRIRPR